MQKLSIPHFYGKTRAILAGRLAGMAGKALGWPVRTGRICVLDSSALEIAPCIESWAMVDSSLVDSAAVEILLNLV